MSFQILSLSGGGYLGLYTISVLADLERHIERPIATCFDLLAGTSIGGIIALGLAAEKPADQIKAAFEQDGTSIFSSRPLPKIWVTEFIDFWRSFFSAKYDNKVLREMLIKNIRQRDSHRAVESSRDYSRGEPHERQAADVQDRSSSRLQG